MRCLGKYSRAIVAGASFAAFAGAFVTTPNVVRGAAGPALTTTPLVRPIPVPSAVAVVLPRRDPFTGGEPRAVAATASNVAQPATALLPPVPPLPSFRGASIPAVLGRLPPNAGAMESPSPFAAQNARVTAVVTGARPYALLDDAGTTRLVTVGDSVGSDAIAAITAGGVRLASGRVLAVAPASSPIRPGSGGQ